MAWPSIVLPALGKLKDWYTQLNAYFLSSKTEFDGHINGTANKHAASIINNDTVVSGANLKEVIDNISITGSEHDAFVTGSLIDAEDENFGAAGIATYLNGRMTKWENKTIAHQADITQQSVAYVATNGNDATGVIGNKTKRFATINAVLDAMPSTGGIISVGDGVFPPIDSTKLKSNVTFIGSRKPTIKSDYSALENGTIIQGPIIADGKSNLSFINLGVDSGLTVCNALYAGVAKDGLAIGNGSATNPLPNSPVTNIWVEHVVTLVKDSTSTFHACLLENIINSYGNDITTYLGYHGIVLKAQDSVFSNLKSYGSNGDGLIIKDDFWAHCRRISVNNVYLGSLTGVTGAGLYIFAGDTGDIVQGVNISNVICENTSYFIKLESVAGATINSFHIDNFIGNTCQSNAITLIGTVINSKFSNINCQNTPIRGITMDSNANNNQFSNINLVAGAGSTDIGIVAQGVNSWNNVHVSGYTGNDLFVSTGLNKFSEITLGNPAIGGDHSTAIIDGETYPIVPIVVAPFAAMGSGNSAVQYYIVNSVVHLEGLISGSALASTIFTLLVGYRPKDGKRIIIATSVGYATLSISSTGIVALESVSATPAWFSLDGVSFRI